MADLVSTSNRIRKILERDPKARKNDDYLIREVYAEIMKENGIDCAYMSWETLILNRKEFHLPSFETIRRARQHLQAYNPSLRADKETQDARSAEEKVYREFARS